jgi:hypothetical protein
VSQAGERGEFDSTGWQRIYLNEVAGRGPGPRWCKGAEMSAPCRCDGITMAKHKFSNDLY